ncbi:MAG TPA: hypothetical protein VMZ22_10220 [Acidimicrobiales bacterium]|nr:hypothetical protein [Acidimicrobiales bacterium]
MRRSDDLILATASFLGSAGSAQEYLGYGGLALAAAVAVATPAVARLARHHIADWPRRRVLIAAAAVLVGVVALFAALYPRANYQSGYRGTDRDDSADIAVTAVFHGESPYLVSTYLGNEPDITPVEIWLAAPARLLAGKSAWQNPLALIVVAALALWLGRARPHVGLVALALVVTSVGVEREIVTGGGLVAGALFVSAVLVWMAGLDRAAPPPAVFGVALGLALSCRPSWAALGPLVLGYLWRVHGGAAAIRTTLIGAAAALVAIVPVFVVDPGGFVPWDSAAGFTDLVRRESPLAFAVACVIAGAAALIAALRVRPLASSLFAWLFVVECAVLLIPVVTQSVGRARVDFAIFELGYGVQAVILGVAAWFAANAETPAMTE